MYEYACEVVRVVDGDTVDLRIDLGFHLSAALRFRLLGVDTPERGVVGWSEATAFTRDWLASRTGLRARTEKSDSFGRWLAEITCDGESLNAALLASGHAVPYQR